MSLASIMANPLGTSGINKPVGGTDMSGMASNPYSSQLQSVGLPSSIDPNKFIQGAGPMAGNAANMGQPFSISDWQNYIKGNPDNNNMLPSYVNYTGSGISGGPGNKYGGNQFTLNPDGTLGLSYSSGSDKAGNATYKLNPTTGMYDASGFQAATHSSPNVIPALEGIALVGSLGAAGAGGAFSGLDVGAGTGAATPSALANTVGMGGNVLDYGSVPGSFGGAGGAAIAGPASAGALPAASTPGLAGLSDSALVSGAADSAAAGVAPQLAADASAISGFGAGNIASEASMLGAGGGLGSSLLNIIKNDPMGFLKNAGNLATTLGQIGKNGGAVNSLTQPYYTARNNAQPAESNLLALMDPNNFYNSTVGKNLMATETSALNNKASAAGRGSVGSQTGIDTTNLLNQYMAQQWQGALNASANATSPLVGAVNATLPNFGGGYGGFGFPYYQNSTNGLASLFSNPLVDQAGNSFLNYLWNGQG